MAPPPITPSPHRFITNKPTNPTPKPSSSLRFQQQPQVQPSSSQFASTPRFSFSSSQRPTRETGTPATQYSSPLSRRPHIPIPIAGKKEDIEEISFDCEDEGTHHEAEPFDFVLPAQPTRKRRRPNPNQEAITISSSPSPSPPSTPPHPTIEHDKPPPPQPAIHQTPTAHHPPRFVLPTPTTTTTTTNPTIPSRPPLILPPRSPTPPLLEAPAFLFSPHRRGQKYLPGGLASTVRDWIIETAQVGYGRRGGGQEVEWDVRFRVGECKVGNLGVGMVLVRDRREGKGWILIGKGRGDGEVRMGCLVGVREPSWEVEVQGEVWRIGVEWRVLDG